MSDDTYVASLYPGSGLRVDALTGTSHATPGNVGVCLSGGGSRALSAGMGQLRALNHLCDENDVSLLSQTKAVSTVSGGSWLGITFEFQGLVPDDTYLNTYVADPGELTRAQIDQLPDGNIGQQVTHDVSVPAIALQDLFYHLFKGTPADMLWQTVIGHHILAPYGLYTPGHDEAPATAFSYNSDSVEAILALPGQNPSLTAARFHTLSTNARRPFFVCNTAMFVEGAEPRAGDYRYLAPVQCTPFFTGIVGTPGGTDTNGCVPGGGGVTSFAFNSTLETVESGSVSISEARPWSVMDCVGASSAAFAETLANLFAGWRDDPASLLQTLRAHGETSLAHVRDDLPDEQHSKAVAWLERVRLIDDAETGVERLFEAFAEHELERGELHAVLTALCLTGLVPAYDYWPVVDAAPHPNIRPTMFADGGNLENTGVASLLSYSDIDSVIAFVNSPTLLAPATTDGPLPPIVLVNDATKVITTEIVVDGQVPPLFGYQPYDTGTGSYVPYDGGANLSKDTAWGVHNQVFECGAFVEFLSGIWTAAGGSKAPAIFSQTMTVVANTWFGVAARDRIDCVWVYTSTVTDWESLLKPEVRGELEKLTKFPNYDTSTSELSPVEINLLSSLSAWSVANDRNKHLFLSLYTTVE